jgi:arginyl-tRNA synthetase
MNVFAHFAAEIDTAIKALQASGVVPDDAVTDHINVEPPRDVAHGDLATNAAMVLAKQAGANPRELAEKLAEILARADHVAAVQVAGPGFINITLSGEVWGGVVADILAAGAQFGRSDSGQGDRVNVEYVSANPTGPLHIGHCRGAVFGDALANLLDFSGYEVTREYYINDAGAQVDILAQSVYLRYREALGETIGAIPDGLYPGDYVVPMGEALAKEHGDGLLKMPEETWLPLVRQAAIAAMMAQIRDDLASLNIRHDEFYSEASLTGSDGDQVAATIEDLRARDLVYLGHLPPPKGKAAEDWEDREQTLFRATKFGDDSDRPLIKSDGSYTYFAADMAYHASKIARGFSNLIDVWGADHGGYVKRMAAAVKALSGGKATLDVKLCQLVRLFRGGEAVKMSKRAGDFVTLREVVDEVGPDSVRFMMLYRKNDATLDFDLLKVREQSRDNPVFYVQYAHARAHSVFRNTKEAFADFDENGDDLKSIDANLLNSNEEIALIKRLSYYPRIIHASSIAHEPHRIAFYLYELAGDFHALWTRGKESPQLRFINADNRDLTMARVALVAATAEVLASGLGVLGVQPIREMR